MMDAESHTVLVTPLVMQQALEWAYKMCDKGAELSVSEWNGYEDVTTTEPYWNFKPTDERLGMIVSEPHPHNYIIMLSSPIDSYTFDSIEMFVRSWPDVFSRAYRA